MIWLQSCLKHSPSSKGVPSGLKFKQHYYSRQKQENTSTNLNTSNIAIKKSSTHPKMTAFHTIILFSEGAPLTPAGGSSCSLTQSDTHERRLMCPLLYTFLNCLQVSISLQVFMVSEDALDRSLRVSGVMTDGRLSRGLSSHQGPH